METKNNSGAIQRFTNLLSDLNIVCSNPLVMEISLMYLEDTTNLDFTEMALYVMQEKKRQFEFFNCPKEDWNMKYDICIDFEKISNLLINKADMRLPKEQTFSDQEKKEIIFYALEKNIASGIIDDKEMAFNPIELRLFLLNAERFVALTNLISSDCYRKSKNKTEELLSNEEELSNEEKSLLRKFKHFLSVGSKSKENIATLHQVIKEHYFDKKESFELEDIKVIIDALRGLNINHEICISIEKALRKEIRSRKSLIKKSSFQKSGNDALYNGIRNHDYIEFKSAESSGKTKEEQERWKKEEEERRKEQNKKRRTEKEGYKYLNDIYNIEEKSLLVTPTNEIIENWVEQAKTNHLPVETIYEFLRATDRAIRQMDPIIRYGLLYQKLKYYKEEMNIPIDLEDMELCIDGLIEAREYAEEVSKKAKEERKIEEIKAQKDTEFWHQELENRLNNTMKLLPKNYEYEMNRIK